MEIPTSPFKLAIYIYIYIWAYRHNSQLGFESGTKRASGCKSEVEWVKMGCRKWGCNRWGFEGCLAVLLEIGLFQPFSPVFCLFCSFPKGLKRWIIQKSQEKGLFPSHILDLLKPSSLKPPFAAPQSNPTFFSLLDAFQGIHKNPLSTQCSPIRAAANHHIDIFTHLNLVAACG